MQRAEAQNRQSFGNYGVGQGATTLKMGVFHVFYPRGMLFSRVNGHCMRQAQLFLPFTPLVICGIAFFEYRKRLCTDIPYNRRHPIFDLEMNES